MYPPQAPCWLLAVAWQDSCWLWSRHPEAW